MPFKKSLSHKFNRKHILPALCAAGVMLTACQKEPTRDVELVFYHGQYGWNYNEISFDKIRECDMDPSIRNVYIVPHRDSYFTNLGPDATHDLCDALHKRIKMSTKNHGRGPLVFARRNLTPRDSLCMTADGFNVFTVPAPTEKSR